MQFKGLIAYYGGKSNLVKHILPMIPPHAYYIEPFFGGGSIFFHKPPVTKEVINDLNGELMNLYRIAKHRFLSKHLISLVESSLHSEELHKLSREIYQNPEKYNKSKRAWATWYNSNFSFSRMLGGGFAMSYGEGRVGEPTTLQMKVDCFRKNILRLRNATLMQRPALDLLKQNVHNNSEVFAYIDPPYFNSDCGHYKGYSESDFIDLLTFLGTEFKGRFLLSTYPSEPLTDAINKCNWNNTEIKQQLRASQSGGESPRMKTESLTYNYELPKSKLF